MTAGGQQMLRRIVGALACTAVLLFAAPADAQESATLVLRSGERISGELVDLNARGFAIRVGGELRRVNKGDVAIVEFSGAGGAGLNSDWNSRLSSGQQVVQLRSGETIAGNLYDISGTHPLKITVDTGSGRRDFNSSEVGRIYLSSQPGAVATGGTSAQPPVPGAIVVAGNQQWVATGLTVRSGETITFQTTGEVRLSANANDRAQAAGAMSQRKAPGSPLPNEFAGALIARIGNGQPFAIGNQTSVRMPASGPLYLGVNDDAVGDNSGQFNVVITRPRR
jgi:hypothetical protein